MLEKEKIFCIASKDDEDEKVYFFYGQERVTKQFILLEINLSNGDSLTANIKAADKQLLKDFVEYFKELLSKASL